MLTASLIASGTPASSLDEDLRILSKCRELTAPHCLMATTRIAKTGDRGLNPMLKTISEMTQIGQTLAVSIMEDNHSPKASKALCRLIPQTHVSHAVKVMVIQILGDRFEEKITRRTVRSTLIRALKNPSSFVRAQAARVLGNRASLQDRKVINALAKNSNDPDETVRAEVVLGLGMIGHLESGELVWNALLDKSLRVRIAAASALTFIKFPLAIERLIESLRTENATLRRAISKALMFQSGHKFGEDYPLWRTWYDHR
jgi:hypothetical protein